MKTHAAASACRHLLLGLIAMAPRRLRGSAVVVTLKATFPLPLSANIAPSCGQLSAGVALHDLLGSVQAIAGTASAAGFRPGWFGHSSYPPSWWKDHGHGTVNTSA